MVFPFTGYEVDEELQPVARLFDFDLEQRLESVVALEARVGEEAFSAQSLGTRRLGNATVIGAEGLMLTIGYLVTEADEVIVTTNEGARIEAHVLATDQATGFAVIHALEPLGLPALRIGDLLQDLRNETALVFGRAAAALEHALLRPRWSRASRSPAIGSTISRRRCSWGRRIHTGAVGR